MSYRSLHHFSVVVHGRTFTTPVVLIVNRDDYDDITAAKANLLEEAASVIQQNIPSLLPELSPSGIDMSKQQTNKGVVQTSTFVSATYIFDIEVQPIESTYPIITMPAPGASQYTSDYMVRTQLVARVSTVAGQRARTAKALQRDPSKLDGYTMAGAGAGAGKKA